MEKQQKEDSSFIHSNLDDICASYQYTLVTTLMRKLRKATRAHGIKNVAIAGGVSANKELRSTLNKWAEKERWNTFIPEFQYCTDNAGMIAIAAHFKYLQDEFVDQSVSALPRMKF